MLSAAARLSGEFGPLTGVVNDAMWIRYGPIETLAENDLDRMLAVGVKGAIWGVQALLAHRGPAASVVNLASPVADLGMANTVAYTAVKGAIVALTRQMAVELGPQGIRVAAPAPCRRPARSAGRRGRLRQAPPRRRLVIGREAEIAAAIAFLCGRKPRSLKCCMSMAFPSAP
jgi:NAD(P)-dependent dehydrogenase (short-subunit alcohol dehydrogenase family)